VWLDNSGSAEAVRSEVDRLWTDRLCPFDTALRNGAPPPSQRLQPVASDPTWPEQYERLAARIARAVGDVALRLDHVGLTAVPGVAAPDVLEVQVAVRSSDQVAGFVERLAAVGFLEAEGPECDVVGSEFVGEFVSADPGRPARVYVREAGSTAYREALLLRDWMRQLPDDTALTGENAPAALGDQAEYAGASHGWGRRVVDSAERWAVSSGWREPGAGTSR
jgi:dephospho-CoA kinase